ncbi:alpha/beta hydrolase (plasmid) [Lichenicola cladoniae]|uniref:Alpha/beta hydrolase n=1 Tax=Lichenicola cladoniae TaxID=1484109 RepID=A0A6M8HXY9_9PROT|nr:alpha/beta hydrolase [Lichenicola cladoniae]NPD69024.1 alpha/beta hydrolase [Acetobacteraceae bacterium]QKE92961.1 alpha/beta hydrolase [Lichenicola cladoniae]
MTAGAPITGFHSETVTVDGTRLHYWLGGKPDGLPVLLWHGFLSTGYAWHKVAPALADAGLAVLIPDMRGFGDSDKPAGNDGYDNRALANECRALVRQIGFGGGRKLILAAHDMGAPPALIWAADQPEELAGLLYIEGPVMLSDVLQRIVAYTPEAMARGSMWWWILPLAPGVPERLVVGNERAFLTWFYEGATADPTSIDPATVDEYLRTFAGREGVLGAMGVYRAAFTSIVQTEPLMSNKVRVPVVALGGSRHGLGAKVGEMVELIAEHVEAHTLDDSGHFMPEEQPSTVIKHILAMAAKLTV